MKTLPDLPLQSASAPSHKRFLKAACLLLFSFGGLAAASATDVVFSGGGYVITAYTATLSMDNIENESPYASGSLRMELWAFTSPYDGASGTVLTGYQLAVSPSFGSLNADSSFTTSPITLSAPFASAPAGTYYFTLFLTEDQGSSYDDGFVSVYSINLPDQINVEQPGVSLGTYFGVSTAVYVGSGYFYDSDIGYIYPFIDGWLYVSNLNKFLYVNPGDEFTTGIYLYDLTANSWTYTEQSFWPYVYYFNGTGWVDTGLD